MTALALLVPIVQAGAAVVYPAVPAVVQRIEVREWRDTGSVVAADVASQVAEGRAVLRGRPGRIAIVLFIRRDGTYLLDGPFTWPEQEEKRSLDGRWRRSIRIRGPDDRGGDGPIDWLPAGEAVAEYWPRCGRSDGQVVCWGVGLRESGVALLREPGRLLWSIVTGTATEFRSSRWGRLLLVRSPGFGAVPDEERASVSETAAAATSSMRPEAAAAATAPRDQARAAIRQALPSAQRPRSLRLETADVPGAGAIPVTADAIWIYGSDVPEAAWVDVRSPQAGPVYLPLREIAEGPSALAVHLVLEEARSVEGTVVGDRAEPAGGASITVFRIVDVAGAGRVRDPPPRVFVSEVTADAGGRFRLDGLGEGKYEVVALHQQWGRASVPLSESERRIEIHLKAAMLRGRVISAGRPVAGVDVITVPDPEAARAAEDLFDVKGGDTRTASDGRFAVFAAPAGGELRIGGGRYPIRRIALPRMAAGSLDLGDIDLGAAIEISVVLNDDPDCVLRAAGPVGRAGLQVVRGTRVAPGMFRVAIPEPGLWEFGLSCGNVERGLSPGVREIGPQLSGKEVWFLVR